MQLKSYCRKNGGPVCCSAGLPTVGSVLQIAPRLGKGHEKHLQSPWPQDAMPMGVPPPARQGAVPVLASVASLDEVLLPAGGPARVQEAGSN